MRTLKIASVVILLSALGCEASSVQYTEQDLPECARITCETTMSKVLTETAADADFSTGVTYPVAGDAGTIWWDLIEGAVQQLADRSKALGLVFGENQVGITSGWVPGSSNQFDLVLGGSAPSEQFYWRNTDITGAGGIYFPIIVPVGMVISTVSMRISGGTYLSTTHSALPATLPKVRLVRQADGTATAVGSQTDTSATTGAYDAVHTVTLTSNHTVLTNNSYLIHVQGEASTNAANDKLAVLGVSYTLSPP